MSIYFPTFGVLFDLTQSVKVRREFSHFWLSVWG